MAHRNPGPVALRRLLTAANVIAVVGASSKPHRPSHGMVLMLRAAGYRVHPVNPNEASVCGLDCRASLADVPERIDIVNVFRRAEFTPAVADDAVAVGARALWLQLGVWSDAAAERAMRGGLTVVMDLCIGVVHAQLDVPAKR